MNIIITDVYHDVSLGAGPGFLTGISLYKLMMMMTNDYCIWIERTYHTFFDISIEWVAPSQRSLHTKSTRHIICRIVGEISDTYFEVKGEVR
jgi:hypothetical protein